MGILRVFETEKLKFNNAQSLLSTLFVRAARKLLRPSSLKFGGVDIYGSEDRRILSDHRQISTA
jgi:hypothetical protein